MNFICGADGALIGADDSLVFVASSACSASFAVFTGLLPPVLPTEPELTPKYLDLKSLKLCEAVSEVL